MPTMYDSATPDAIPTTAAIVAGYIDGSTSQWPTTAWNRFPNAQKVTITVTGLGGARVCDTEKGNITAAGAAAWARNEIDAGTRPTIYCSLAAHGTVLHYLVQLGIGTNQVDWWIADWDTTPTRLTSWMVARQYASPTNGKGTGGHYDLSVTNGVWPAAATPSNPLAPAPAPGTTPVPPPATAAPNFRKNLGTLRRSVGGSFGGLAAPIIAMHATPSGGGYTFAASDGGTFAFGDAPFDGSMAGSTLAAPMIDSSMSATHKALWLLGLDGGVFALGSAPFYGSMSGQPGVEYPFTGIAARPQQDGYWLAGTDGGVFAFGGAQFAGSMGGQTLAAPISGIACTPSGNGYWLVGADGGIFAFGDAGFHGSCPATKIALTKPVVSIVATKSGNGYWLLSTDGGVFAFGDANYHGSLPGYATLTYPIASRYPIASLTPTPDEGGYWIVSASGQVLAFGNAVLHGAVDWGTPHILLPKEKTPHPTPTPPPAPTGASAAANGAVAFALSKVGHPYSETGALRLGPTYYDCSGLCYMAYQSVGVTIGTWTGAQWPSGSGPIVANGVRNLMPGDLCFFSAPGNAGAPTHVAMVVSTTVQANSVYIVEAADPTLGVITDHFTPTVGAYYGPQQFVGATRPAPA